MDFEKKQLTKADGRYMVMYHFSRTATTEQSAAFHSAEAYLAHVERASMEEPQAHPVDDVKLQPGNG